MYGAKERKGIENYQLLKLRNVVKTNSEKVQKDFVTKYRELKIESNRGKQAPCADTYLMRETAKERNINWCEEYKLNKITLVNYTERGKQLINIGLRNKYQKQGGQIKVKGRENPLTGVRKIGVVQYQIINKKFHQPKKLRLKEIQEMGTNYNCNYEATTTRTAPTNAKTTNNVTPSYPTLLTYTTIFNYVLFITLFITLS